MYLTVRNPETTSAEVVRYLEKNGYEQVYDNKRKLYIFFNKSMLTDEILQLRNEYGGAANEKNEDANCTNREAMSRIDDLEKVVNFITTSPAKENIFEYIPYTKAQKFSKTGSINLFIPNLKSTYSGDYFSQTEVSLQLTPVEILAYTSEGFKSFKLDDVCTIEINTSASFTSKKTPANIISADCKFTGAIPPARNKYLKQKELIPGSSYIDSKGSEYLYIGSAGSVYHYKDEDENGKHEWSHSDPESDGVYLRVTANVKKKLARHTEFKDFLRERFNEQFAKTNDWHTGLNFTTSKKFVSLGNIYFDSDHNKTKDDFVFEKSKGSVPGRPNFESKMIVKINRI